MAKDIVCYNGSFLGLYSGDDYAGIVGRCDDGGRKPEVRSADYKYLFDLYIHTVFVAIGIVYTGVAKMGFGERV